jgi:hypothetical protein
MQRLVLFSPPSPIILDPHHTFCPSGEPPHASPSFSFFCCCVQKPLIEGPQSSSVRSFVPLYNPMRRPRLSSSSATALCSLQILPPGTPPAPPSRRVSPSLDALSQGTTIQSHCCRPSKRRYTATPLTIRQRTGAYHHTNLPPKGKLQALLRTEFSFVRWPST